jgi:hypothetical protein
MGKDGEMQMKSEENTVDLVGMLSEEFRDFCNLCWENDKQIC